MSVQAVRERYCCPDDFLHLRRVSELSSDRGYFQFGPGAICYGRSSNGFRRPRAESALYDTLQDTQIENENVRLPFDPDEIIDNLRLERYRPSELGGYTNLLKGIYYHLRPFTNQFLRKQIQKFRAGDWQRQPFPCWPVDTSVESICETLLLLSLEAQGIDRIPFVWFWPNGAHGCLAMTHDVETEAGRDFCAELMDLDDEFGIKASFQIVPEERYAVPTNLLDSIRNRGFEIGVQDLNHDGRLFDSRDEFLRRAQSINRYGREYGAHGFRAAILYRRPEWYDALDFSFDMSIPNVAHLDPQRGGCCTVMPYFIGDLLELPVTAVQDYTLFHLLNERSIELWKTQVARILEKKGLVSFIVHPDYILERETRSVYESLLVYLRDLRTKTPLWFALPSEIDSWWRARGQMSLVKDGDSWRITGEVADRAVLAFARKVDDRLVYELAGSPLMA